MIPGDDYSLLCPFLDKRPQFAYGVEFGLLFARMKVEARMVDIFCRENQEQILLLANRLGWKILKIKNHDNDWFWLEMEKEEEQKNGPGK